MPIADSSGAWPIPALLSGMTWSDVGSSGLRQYSGWVREEFLPQLVGLDGARTYREMLDNSSTVGAIIFAIQQQMRKVVWRTKEASDRPEAKEAAEFADSLRFDMSETWEEFIAEALSMLGYGFAPHEIVYKRRNGKNVARGEPPSKFNDGRIGIRRLPIRGQDTVIKWFFDQNGTTLGLTQQPWVGVLIDIPIEKLLLFRPTVHKGNPEGRSILRNAYRPYTFIKRLEEQEAIMIERFGGLPVITVPNALLEAAGAGDAKAQATLAAYKRIVTNVRVDEQMGIVLPSDTYPGAAGMPSNVPMYGFRLETPNGGRTSVDAGNTIERYKLEITMTVLADFLSLGHAARGTQNLAISKVDMFMSAIEGWLNMIASVLNRFLLPRVWALNGMDPALMPEYVPDLAQRIDLDSLGNFVLHLAQAGMQMFPDVELENFIRDAAGLPDITDEAAYAAAAAGTDPDLLKRMLKAGVARRLMRKRKEGGTAVHFPFEKRKALRERWSTY